MIWQELIQQVGVLWIILVFVVTAGLAAFAIVSAVMQKRLVAGCLVKFGQLAKSVNALEGCRIDNLEPVRALFNEQMNDEVKDAFNLLTEDSQNIYGRVWIPDPRPRLPLPEILTPPVRATLRRYTGSAILLGGIAATTLAITSGYAMNSLLPLTSSLFRLIAALPLVVGALAMLALFHVGDQRYQDIKAAWHSLMLSVERRLPVYSQAAETAVMINRMKDYDAQMTQSVKVLAEQVQTLASGKLTDAVSNAIKYVMAATVAPAVVRSTESLATLAQEIEKQQKATDHSVVRLYTDLEARQQKQADLWHKRYQEISDVMAEHQGTLVKNLASGQQQLVDDLGRSQTFALERIVDEQKQTLQHMNNVAQKSWTILQEKLTLVINQLAEGQQRLLTNLSDQQQSTLMTVSTASTKAGETLQQQYQTTMDQLQKVQTDIWQKQNDNLKQAYDTLVQSQKESFAALADQQQKIHQKSEKLQHENLLQMQSNQSSALRQLTESQAAILNEIDQRQEQALQTISSQQAASLQTISSQQAIALQEMNTVQNTTLSSIVRTQDDTLSSMARRVHDALQQMSEKFSGEVSGTLASYLDPVTTRLQVTADSLIAAQDYARDVKDVLKLQSDSAKSLQESIGNLFAQLIDTRKAMTEDLQSMKKSSEIMSKAADSMSSVYAGSQSGLSEAISQMSGDLLRLSDVLGSVMSTSAEQTRMIQSQTQETYEVNQKHLDAVRGQITFLSDELSTRIEELMIGFSRLTEDLVKNIDKTINTQNDTLGGNLSGLTEIMGNEARSMSLFAQQITMDIDTLNETLKSAINEFDSGMRKELSSVLDQFDQEISDVLKRLSRVASELGDSVEALPKAIRHAAASAVVQGPDLPTGIEFNRRG